jgi:DNA-binding Lrp family transcriptional regulator
MKNLEEKLVALLKTGFCTPKLSTLARKLRQPTTTIQYNIKKLEKEGKIRAYGAVFDYKKIGKGHCAYVLVSISPDLYNNPEKLAEEIANHPNIESVDICTGNWELVVKMRAKDIDHYYGLIKAVINRPGVVKTQSLTSLKQIKTEFIKI